MLPVEPPGYGNSPYQAISAFAGNPLLIGPDWLASRKLLAGSKQRLQADGSGKRADFARAQRLSNRRLALAWEAFNRMDGGSLQPGFRRFCKAQARWLDGYSLFCALREEHGGVAWSRWPKRFRLRDPASLERFKAQRSGRIAYHAFVQFLFECQWQSLRRRAAACGIGLIGDVPFFVAYDSADVWANPQFFQLDAAGRPREVAGVPPDYFSRNGQLWGSPLYRWDRLRETGFSWWTTRLNHALERFDAVRLDHFIGFHRCWAVRASAKTARTGRFVPGPGASLFKRLLRSAGDLPIIAEDLGLVTPEVTALRRRLGLPGMRVLQFAFDDPQMQSEHLPQHHERKSVVYTGTHDNDTTAGWFACKPCPHARNGAGDRDAWHLRVREYLGCDGSEINWDLIRLALNSVANLAIIPMQDLLGLGSQARMNAPGTMKGNWVWRMRRQALSDQRLIRRLREMTLDADRRA
jgi:4-alpha-glucanotransferase